MFYIARLLAFLCLLFCAELGWATSIEVPAQDSSVAKKQSPSWPGVPSRWNGFDRYDFEIAGRKAYVVQPKQIAPGNPWVWRARFPNFHLEADLILLERGFHIARIDTDGMLGNPASLEIWDQFYQFAQEHGLAPKVALEGVSRGGLFVYGFALRWPERVACIYADTPVLDIRSWPGGKGNGRGDANTWNRCLELYQLDEASVNQFKGNPVDQATRIAESGIPILHIISLNDQVVPPAENTLLLKKRLEDAGGEMLLLTVDQGTPESHGHHFSHPAPVQVADFIERHGTVLPTQSPDESATVNDFFTRRDRLGHSAMVFRETGKGRVAFVGGSITRMSGWRDEIKAYLQSRFPDTEFDFIDAGIPSTGSVPGAFRLQNDVLQKGKVDLLFEEASVNDLTNGRTREQTIRGMEGIVRHALNSNPRMDIVMMHFACPSHSQDYRQGKTPQVIQWHESVATAYNVTTINLANEVHQRIESEQFDWPNDFRDLHPSAYGHRLYASTIRRCLSQAWDRHRENTQLEVPERLDDHAYDQGEFVDLKKATLAGFTWHDNVDLAEEVGKGTRPGFTNVPMLTGTLPGQALQLEFEGRAVGILVAAGPDSGKIDYRIDAGPWKTLSLFTRWSSGLHLPWVYVLGDELSAAKTHVLEIRVADDRPEGSHGHACRIVRLLVNH